MRRMARLLVVESDTSSNEELTTYLSKNGHEVWATNSAEDGARRARAVPPDLMIVAMSLRGVSGTELCRAVRADRATQALPIILLSPRDDEIDRVVGLEVGADDVVPKPYSLRELGLRVRALLRRKRGPARAPRPPRASLRLDPSGHQVTLGASHIVLTALEFRLLLVLHERRGRVQSRSALLEDVWGSPNVSGRTVDACVKRLRQKLGDAGHCIQTVRGVGYRFTGEAVEAPRHR